MILSRTLPLRISMHCFARMFVRWEVFLATLSRSGMARISLTRWRSFGILPRYDLIDLGGLAFLLGGICTIFVPSFDLSHMSCALTFIHVRIPCSIQFNSISFHQTIDNHRCVLVLLLVRTGVRLEPGGMPPRPPMQRRHLPKCRPLHRVSPPRTS